MSMLEWTNKNPQRILLQLTQFYTVYASAEPNSIFD